MRSAPWFRRTADRADPAVLALAREMRRVLLDEGDPARDYLEILAGALVARAVLICGGGRTAGNGHDLAPFNLRRVQAQIDSRFAGA